MVSPNRKQEMQQALVWDMRCLRSAFGRQILEQQQSEPSASIGTQPRNSYAKVMLPQVQSS